MPRIILNVTEGQKALWVDRAFEERLTLSEWIRRSCDGGLGAGVREIGSASENGGQPEVRASGVSPSTGPMAPARYPASPAPRSFRPDPKGGGKVKRGLGSGEVLAAGSPPVTVAPVSPEPSPLAAGDTANTGGRATRPPMSASGSSEGEVSDAVTPAASGPKAFRPDPKRKP